MVCGDGEAPIRLSTLAMAWPTCCGPSSGPSAAVGGPELMSPATTWAMSTIWATSIPAGQRGRGREDRLPGRELGHQGPAAGRVELGEDIVEEEGGYQPGPRHHQLVYPDPQGQGQAALLALGGMGPGLPPFEGQHEIVAVGPDGVDAPAQVVGPVRRQRIEQLAGPTADVVLARPGT